MAYVVSCSTNAAVLTYAFFQVAELSFTYSDQANCQISAANQNKTCTFEVTVTQEMKAPVFVYYELTNFYQNHRRYVKSRSDPQLRGDLAVTGLPASCDPYLTSNTSKTYWPCGLIAGSFFNGTTHFMHLVIENNIGII